MKCYRGPKIDPHAKFDQKIDVSLLNASEWDPFFDSIEKKKKIGCDKIFQLGKKIHVIFAFSQNWNFAEDFKGYMIGQEFYKEIYEEVRKETYTKYFKLNYFEQNISTSELEYQSFFVSRMYSEGRLLDRSKTTKKQMLKDIKKELHKFAKP